MTMLDIEKRCSGFSAIELMLVLVVAGLLILTSNQIINRINQSTLADQLAKEALEYVTVVNRYLTNHYEELIQQTDNVLVVAWSEIVRDEGAQLPEITHNNLIPCVFIFTSGHQLQPYLFFATNSGAVYHPLPRNLILAAMSKIGASGGYVDLDGMIYGTEHKWSLSTANLQSALPICGGIEVAPFSLAINLGMLSGVRPRLADTLSLDRAPNFFAESFSRDNTNTLQTVIANGAINVDSQHPEVHKDDPRRLIFNNRSFVGLQAATAYGGEANWLKNDESLLIVRSGPDIVYHGQDVAAQGGLRASTIRPLAKVVLGAACSKLQIGAVAQVAPTSSEMQQLLLGQAQCTYNPLFCQIANDTGDVPCWLPINSIDIRVAVNSDIVDCSKLVGPGFFIVPNSEQYNHGKQPSADPGWCCAWDDGPRRRSSSPNDSPDAYQWMWRDNAHSVAVMYKAKYMAYFENHASCIWGGMCNIWPGSKWTEADVASVVCTNDASILTYLEK